jgi:hypothetical protein
MMNADSWSRKTIQRADTPGVLYGCANKRVAEKGICKKLKTKDKQIDELAKSRNASRDGVLPHPRYFAKRGCKLLKTNEASRKKRGKRVQEAASC